MPSRLTAAQQALRDRIDRLAPALRAEIARALARLQRKVSAARLLRAIETRDAFALRGLTAQLSEDLKAAERLVERAFALSAAVAAESLPGPIQASLNLSNPLAEHVARQAAAAMVTRVTEETRRAIREVITSAFHDGLSPRETATLLRPLIGLTERQARAVLTRRADLLAGGATSERVSSAIAQYTHRLIKQRALTIARTETIRASTEGQVAVWQQAQARGLLPAEARKRWLVTHDDRLCPICAPLDGVSAPIGGTFPGGVIAPPRHPNCRCAVALDLRSVAIRRAA